MTQKEYEALMGFLKGRLKRHPETGLSGNRAEGYEKGIQAAMSKVRSLYKTPYQQEAFVLVAPGNVSYPYGIKGCSFSRDEAYTKAEAFKSAGEGHIEVIKVKIL